MLDPTAAGRNDQGLSQGVAVPGGAGIRLEGDARAGRAGRGLGLQKQGVDANRAGKPFGRTLHRRLGAAPREP